MSLVSSLKRRINKLLQLEEDPVEGSKTLIRNLQRVVGVHNVFGESGFNWSLNTILATIVIPGAFVYLGIFSQVMYLWQMFPNTVATFQAINCISSTLVPFSIYIFMWTSRTKLRNIFEMNRQILSSLPSDSLARSKMVEVIQKAWYISLLVVVNIGATHFMYLIFPSLLTIFGNRRYLPSTPGTVYGLIPRYETPNYELTFLIAVLGTIFSAVNQTGYIVLFLTIMATEIGQLFAITENLNEIHHTVYNKSLDKYEKNQLVDKKLRFCIYQHQFLLKYHDKIKQLYQYIFGLHFFLMIVDLVSTLQTINTWDFTNTFITGITGVIPLFLYCFGGESVYSAAIRNSLALYSCGWEMMDKKQAKSVLFMMRASQKPLILTAAGTFVMNRETFAGVVQIIYKICAVLQSDSNYSNI